MTITRIVSGGQTGADVAGLDAAIKRGIVHGGWIPKGRLTEDGPLPEKYLLQETPNASYPKRTEKNVLDSDGTVIFTHGALTGGSLLTRKKALQHGKPVLHLDMNTVTIDEAVEVLRRFVGGNCIEALNVAGSRGSKDSLIYSKVFETIRCLINNIKT